MPGNPIYLPEKYSVKVWLLPYEKKDLIYLTHITNVFARTNTGVVGSNPNRGMDICLRLFCVCVLCRLRPCDGLISRPRSPTGCLEIKKLKWNEAFHGCPLLQPEQQEYEWMNDEWLIWRESSHRAYDFSDTAADFQALETFLDYLRQGQEELSFKLKVTCGQVIII
jgi:hypothetical protein